MSSVTPIQERNRALARQIADEVHGDPRSVYAGRVVGVTNGQVALVAHDWDEIAGWLRQTNPDPQTTLCFEAGEDVDDVQVIWGLR